MWLWHVSYSVRTKGNMRIQDISECTVFYCIHELRGKNVIIHNFLYMFEFDILGPIGYFSDRSIKNFVSFERAIFDNYSFK